MSIEELKPEQEEWDQIYERYEETPADNMKVVAVLHSPEGKIFMGIGEGLITGENLFVWSMVQNNAGLVQVLNGSNINGGVFWAHDPRLSEVELEECKRNLKKAFYFINWSSRTPQEFREAFEKDGNTEQIFQ